MGLRLAPYLRKPPPIFTLCSYVDYNIFIMPTQFAVYIEQDEDGIFVGSVPLIPSCHAEGRAQEEMLTSLTEVLKLCLRNMDTSTINKIHFVGIQNLDISHA